MNSILSPDTLALLKARAGQGVSNDPQLLTRLNVRLLQNYLQAAQARSRRRRSMVPAR
jgi:hypothetical protein